MWITNHPFLEAEPTSDKGNRHIISSMCKPLDCTDLQTCTEYSYGGHPYSYTGVYNMSPCQEDEIWGEGVRFRESLKIGRTHLSEREVEELVHALGKEYNGNTYHVLNRCEGIRSRALLWKVRDVLTQYNYQVLGP